MPGDFLGWKYRRRRTAAKTSPARKRVPTRPAFRRLLFAACGLSADPKRGQAWCEKGSGTFVRSTLRAVPAKVPDPFSDRHFASPRATWYPYSKLITMVHFPESAMNIDVPEITRQVAERREKLAPLYKEIEKVIVGQRTLIERLLIGLMTGGHIL